MDKYIVLASILVLSVILPYVSSRPTLVEAQATTQNEVLSAPQPVHTTSRFETKLKTEVETIDRPIITKDDPDRELDDDTIIQEGQDGKKTTVVKIYFAEGQEYSREILSSETIPPQEKIISHGTKIVWRNLDTPDGSVSYWRKLRVWATQYDSHCPGCDETTATGLKQGKGVIAVDPKVIKLGSKLYIPGYGVAIAGDTGGAIKGDIIDLGFVDAHTSGWISKFVDVYLMGN